MLEAEMILPSECQHFPKTGTLSVLEGRRLWELANEVL